MTLPVTVVKMLEQKGDSDAALLYLALLLHQGTVPPRALAGELRWDSKKYTVTNLSISLSTTSRMAGARFAVQKPL